MSADHDPDFAAAEAALFEADLELGRQAFEIAIAPRFPEYTELVHVGVRRDEPHLIYRAGDLFLIVDTAINDPQQEMEKAPVRELADGRTAERGTREYLLAGFQDAGQATMENRSLVSELISAVLEHRVRYILVTVKITESAGERELTSVKLSEFEL